MDVRIGVIDTPKELKLEMEGTAEEVEQALQEQLSSNGTFIWLTDIRGLRVGVPVDKLAYVEIESEEAGKQVGFG